MDKLLTIDCGNVCRWSCVCKLGILKIFLFLQIPTTSLIKPTNDAPVLKHLWKFKTTLDDVLENHSISSLGSISGFTIKLTATIPYSSIVIECRELLCSHHLTLLVTLPLKKNIAMSLVAITQLKQWPINRMNCETMVH